MVLQLIAFHWHTLCRERMPSAAHALAVKVSRQMQKVGTASHASVANGYDRSGLAALFMLILVVCTDMLHTRGQKTNKCCHLHSHLQFRGEGIFIEVVISTADYLIVVALRRRYRAAGFRFH